MMRKPAIWLTGVLAGAAVAVAIGLLLSSPAPVPVERASAPPTTNTAPPTVTAPTAALPAAAETLTAKVERLTTSGKNNPADAFAAYEVVANCSLLESVHKAIDTLDSETRERARKQWAPREAELNQCATLPQYQRASRLANLAIAAKAGVPGAGLAFFREGPLGEGIAVTLQSRPNELVAAWKEEAINYVRRDAIQGDLNALATMTDIYTTISPDRKLALAYDDAMWRVKEVQTGSASADVRQMRFVQLSHGLSAAEIAEAKAIAADVAFKCCSTSALPPAGKEPK